jgi:hypothetical protein
MKLFKPAPVAEATVRVGYAESMISAILYAVLRASILGAILVTGYLGGAVASNIRASRSPSTPSFLLFSARLCGLDYGCATRASAV